MHKYYSTLEPKTPTEDDSIKKPVVISMKNVSFNYSQLKRNESGDDDTQSFYLNPVSGDIKKVRRFKLERVFGFSFLFIHGFPRFRVIWYASKVLLAVEKLHF